MVRVGLLGLSGAGACPNLLQRRPGPGSAVRRSTEYQRFSSGVSSRSGPLQQIWTNGAVAGPCADGGLGDHPGTRAGLPTPGRLFSGRLRAFPGNDIMMAHSHEVQFVVEQAREDRLNNRILVLPGGRLVRASDPYPGSMHDVAALDASGLLEGMDPSGWIGDKGYVGRGMITPHKKPPNGELDEKAKEANRSVNRIRRAERAHHRSHQVLENPPHPLQETPGNIRADHHRGTRTLFLQDHPLNNLHDMAARPPPRSRIFRHHLSFRRGRAAPPSTRRKPRTSDNRPPTLPTPCSAPILPAPSRRSPSLSRRFW